MARKRIKQIMAPAIPLCAWFYSSEEDALLCNTVHALGLIEEWDDEESEWQCDYVEALVLADGLYFDAACDSDNFLGLTEDTKDERRNAHERFKDKIDYMKQRRKSPVAALI